MMRRLTIILVLVLAVVVAGIVAAPRLMLHFAKVRAVKKFADDEKTLETIPVKILNIIPASTPIKLSPAVEYDSTVWMNITNSDCALGFPSDQFTRDSDPRRKNAVIHHSGYRLLISSGASATEFAPAMEPLGFTNLYDFVLAAYRATERDIPRQPNVDALQRHLVLLEVKQMFAPLQFEDSCIEFARDDLKGFIIGDPRRTKILFVRVYVQSEQQFFDLGVIQEAHMQLSDFEEMIRVLKVGPNKAAAASSHPAGQSDGLEKLAPSLRSLPAAVAGSRD